MKIVFFYNSKSGTILNNPDIVENTVEKLQRRMSEKDSLKIYDVQENDEQKIIEENSLTGEDRILIAGGDGTISSVIDNTVELKIPYGILPLGTFNNFSKSLGISQDVGESIEQFFSGTVKRIDVGKLNGKIMINNSSIGVYPKLVSIRESHQVRFGLGKPTAMLISILKSIFLFPLIKVSLVSHGKEVSAKTSFAMVSNNKYKLNMFEISERESLNEGKLYVYFAKCTTRFCVIKVLLKTLLNKLNREKDFELIAAKSVELRLKKKTVKTALDGEVFDIEPPLRYEICPECLQIIVPKSYE